MSVIAEAISVVVRLETLAAKFPGGVAAYWRRCPNATFCADDNLARIGFLSPDETRKFIRELESLGFVHVQDGQAIDLVVVDQLRGPTTACSWIDGGRFPDGSTAVWLAGTEPGELRHPMGWKPEHSKGMTFVPTEDVDSRILPVGRENGLDTVLDFETGKEIFTTAASAARPDRDDVWRAAVRFLASQLDPGDGAAIRTGMAKEGLRSWSTRNHFPFGMQVRNALRAGGFTEAALGVTSLDDIWSQILRDAVTLEN